MTKVAIVDDDKDLVATVQAYLKGANYTISSIHDGREALEHLRIASYDIIILDLSLPGVDGITICKSLREEGLQTPIIMLTGKTQIIEREAGLDAGADDYLTKPFSVRELAARVRALLRRPIQVLGPKLIVGDITLDTKNCEVFKGEESIKMLPIDFALLEFLFKHPDDTFSSSVLLERVWHTDSEASTTAIRSSVRRIRRKLDKTDDEDKSVIQTVSKVGYRLRKP